MNTMDDVYTLLAVGVFTALYQAGVTIVNAAPGFAIRAAIRLIFTYL